MDAKERRKRNAENLRKVRRDVARDKYFEDFTESILKNNYKSIKVPTLLEKFEVKKRTDKNIEEINLYIEEKGLFTIPVLTKDLPQSASIRFQNYPLKVYGDIFSKERDLEEFIIKGRHYKKLGMSKKILNQYPTSRSQDRVDLVGYDKDENIVIIEFKRYTGGKTSIEQILRYNGYLKRDYPKKSIRCILVTGVQNSETAITFLGMHKEQRKLLEWYIYKFDEAKNKLEFVKVTDEYIENQIGFKLD